MAYVRESKAAGAISAYVILKGTRHVATVQIHYGSGGGVQADCWQYGEPRERSARYYERVELPRILASKWASAADKRKARAVLQRGEKTFGPFSVPDPEAFTYQTGKAGGYGYDKKTAALSGMIIDGHKLTNHCGASAKPPRGLDYYPADFKPPKGYRTANYFGPSGGYRKGAPEGVTGYADCYRLEGFGYLEAIGYRVIQAI